MTARTYAARHAAAQKDITMAKHLGVGAALKDDASNSQKSLVLLSSTLSEMPALLAIAEGAYFAKLQDLSGEASA